MVLTEWAEASPLYYILVSNYFCAGGQVTLEKLAVVSIACLSSRHIIPQTVAPTRGRMSFVTTLPISFAGQKALIL